MTRFHLLAILVFAGVAGAQSARPDFTGTWKYDAGRSSLKHSKLPEHTWKISPGPDKIQFAETANVDGKETSRTWECSTKGQECQLDEGGMQAKVSMFYNGAALMEFRTKGEDVSRRSYKLSGDGKSLEVDITYIAPERDSEKMVFARVE